MGIKKMLQEMKMLWIYPLKTLIL